MNTLPFANRTHAWVEPGAPVVVVAHRRHNGPADTVVDTTIEKVTEPTETWDVARIHCAKPEGADTAAYTFVLDDGDLVHFVDTPGNMSPDRIRVRLLPADHPDLPEIRRTADALPLIHEAGEDIGRFCIVDGGIGHLLNAISLLEKAVAMIGDGADD